MYTYRLLNIAPSNKVLKETLVEELGISGILAQILINRGVDNLEAAERFLNSNIGHLLDPFLFSQMGKATQIIRKALESRKRVMVFGDYDVDGITGLALLKTTLSNIGIETLYYLPHRIKEGYGLNKDILHIAKQRDIKLLITVDCGINSHEQIKELINHNIDVIVTDHHEPIDVQLPPASAIINPKLKDSGYSCPELAGVTVAYKLCQAITGDLLLDDLDLVCLGTVADVVPLIGENRLIVKEGLSRISQTKKLGLKALMDISGISGKNINSTYISYILGPRLNASGRIDTAEIALRLLMTKEPQEADELARIVDAHNRQRQRIENKILEEAQDLVSRDINFKEHKIIVLAKEGWHEGVLGIVASKLTERFYRPTILISLSDGLCKGSARSIKRFHIFDALLKCKDYLVSFGGHSHAAGLLISRDNVNTFKDRINSLAKECLSFEDLFPVLEIDAELNLSDFNEEVIRELEVLEPFGAGNPPALFYTRGLKIKAQPQLLGRNTLKFWVTDGLVTYPAIGFGMGHLRDSLLDTYQLDLVYTPKIDNWETREQIILEVKDILFR
ncbi:MAG: single-stranded-DNA-specific exonuclease RecJ [Candidatus Omnitrophica bacterium]|nr:single-stranded-DNA-specific exonuclease RecJ [Candidatus Omnitrophota bacterium]